MSGLVKTPRVVVRDDAVPDTKTYKSRLYHIYNDPEVKDDLNRRARAAARPGAQRLLLAGL
jgi:type III restriction enzyme